MKLTTTNLITRWKINTEHDAAGRTFTFWNRDGPSAAQSFF